MYPLGKLAHDKNVPTLKFYELEGGKIIESLQTQEERPFFKHCVAILNEEKNKAYVIQHDKNLYKAKLVKSSVVRPVSVEYLKGQNHLMSKNFMDDDIQVVIPRYLDFMLRYGNNLLIKQEKEIKEKNVLQKVLRQIIDLDLDKNKAED